MKRGVDEWVFDASGGIERLGGWYEAEMGLGLSFLLEFAATIL